MTMSDRSQSTEFHLVHPADVATALGRLYADRAYLADMQTKAYEIATDPGYDWHGISMRWARLFEQELKKLADAARSEIDTHAAGGLTQEHSHTGLLFRHGTNDADIYHEVVVANTYRMPATFEPEDVIVDIGSHIGCFSLAALARGARNVIAVEADPDNYALAQQNLKTFLNEGRAHMLHKAVWRSDQDRDNPLPKSISALRYGHRQYRQQPGDGNRR